MYCKCKSVSVYFIIESIYYIYIYISLFTVQAQLLFRFDRTDGARGARTPDDDDGSPAGCGRGRGLSSSGLSLLLTFS